MESFSKILEVFKPTGWRAATLSAAGAIIFWILPPELLDKIGPWARPVSLIAFVVFGLIASGDTIEHLVKSTDIERRIKSYFIQRRQKEDLKKYIPFMNEKERSIIAYLIHHNTQSFYNAMDGGHAATLMGRGIIVMTSTGTGSVNQDDAPFTIPPHIWEVLVEHKDLFPLNNIDPTAPHPWRRGWMS